MTKLRIRFLNVILFAVLTAALMTMSACNRSAPPTATPVPPTAVPTMAPTATEAQPTPTIEMAAIEVSPASETSQTESPLAAPESPLAPPSPLMPPSLAPTPVTTADTGGLTGQIIVTRPTGDVAVAGLVIGLAEVILGDDGLPKASGYEASAAPKATTDDYGRFVFNNLKPGRYTLILDAVVTQYQLDNAETGDTILIEVTPNTVLDLGELRYPRLPIPGFQ